ncbi:MAG: hypothetical protein HFE63_07955 [Clostridiales bacterium]|nr:hypothetical protein [Clostridiales bacterium]
MKLRIYSIILLLGISLTSCSLSDQNFDNDTDKSDTIESIERFQTDSNENSTAVSTTDEQNMQTDIQNAELSQEEIIEIIDRNLDIIIENIDYSYTEQDYINAHLDAFDNIVALGEIALPYLNEIGNGYKSIGEDTFENNRCFIAKAAEYAIKPDIYDIMSLSPDDQYAVKATVHSFANLVDPFAGIDYNACVVDMQTNNVLITASDMTFNFSYNNPSVEWSDNSQYAIIQQGYRHYYSNVYLFDVKNSNFICLPGQTEIEEILKQKLIGYDKVNGTELSFVHFYFDEWLDDNQIKITIYLSNNSGYYLDIGCYIYDLDDGKIVSLQCEPSNDVVGTAISQDDSDTDDTSITADNSNLISDEEAIELYKIGSYTVFKWMNCDVDAEVDVDIHKYPDEISETAIYRNATIAKETGRGLDLGVLAYFPVNKDSYAELPEPDIRGNTKIYYGDYEWMQENLRKIFSEDFINRYFNYEFPFIYEDGVVYKCSAPYCGGSHGLDIQNYSVVHRTENELAIIAECFPYDYVSDSYDYSSSRELTYMKFIKDGDLWLIDQATNLQCYFDYLTPDFKIPLEYSDSVPELYKKYYRYFE